MKSLRNILYLTAVLACFHQAVFAQDMVQVKGSDTLINLVQRLAEKYMEKNPGKAVAVTGGGSGTGIAALVNRKCDIADSSRLMKDKEIDSAQAAGVNPKKVVVAIDGLSIIVNPAIGIEKLTTEQVSKIFRGEITNWKDVGGSSLPINLYGRQSNSGTYEFLRDVILKGEYSPKMKQMNGNAQIVESIRQDVSGIGYVGVAYVRNPSGITVVKIAGKNGGEYFSPLDAANIYSGKYPIWRPLNQYFSSKVNSGTKAFLLFELSDEGQRIVEEEGFFMIPGEYKRANSEALGM